ncbi:MAG: hypothetical protein KDJ24_19730 [Gammaproteobacteria bacterium]|nr:hypothetical protein [Gammaproteobacteria bacterium]
MKRMKHNPDGYRGMNNSGGEKLTPSSARSAQSDMAGKTRNQRRKIHQQKFGG